MWQPEPEWEPIRGGRATSTYGVWRAVIGGRPVVVKRLNAPQPEDPVELTVPTHFAWWRRAADVATHRLVEQTPGLRAPTTAVEEDTDGLTLIQEWVEPAEASGLFVARSMGRFGAVKLPDLAWLADHAPRNRAARAERRGGWNSLGRTTASDVAWAIWQARGRLLDVLDGLPQIAQHGDPSRANLAGREGEELIALDWSTLGRGPVGGDLGLYALQAREEFEPLLAAYLEGLPAEVVTPEQVELAARITVTMTALTRADWALHQVAGGEGALGGKFTHPAVAPHIRALQRQHASVEAVLKLV